MNADVSPCRCDAELARASAWLVREAEMLDRQDYATWFACLSRDLRYVMPGASTGRPPLSPGDAVGNAHFDESYESMLVRIKRLSSATGWSEAPPSRTRRFVSNIAVESSPGGTVVHSYLLLLRSRTDSPHFEMISVARRDLLREEDGELRLIERWITADQSTLGVTNLSVLL